MSDPQTAAQWNQVAADASLQRVAAQQSLQQLDAAAEEAEARLTQARNNASVANFSSRYPGFNSSNPNSPGFAEYQAAQEELATANAEANAAAAAYNSQFDTVVSLNTTIANANRQAQLALDSPPGTIANPTTQANPAPANPDPGNNTDVPPPGEEPLPQEQADIPLDDPSLGELGINTQQNVDADLGELGINTDLVPVDAPPISRDDPALGELGINTDQATEADLGELGINTAPPVPPDDPGLPPGEEETLPGKFDDEPSQLTLAGTEEARSTGNTPRFVPLPETLDYRVRVSLAKNADYLYKEAGISDTHILRPLRETDGVIYPYTPQIVTAYSASYASTDLVHSNYKIYNYSGSSVEPITIIGDFTAQDIDEANYVLAVIHFYRSVTKMFYGQDANRGVPPPLVYLHGHGEYGFNNHAMVITSFNFTWPNDVDYINCGPTYGVSAVLNSYEPPSLATSASGSRLRSANLQPGGVRPPPTFGVPTNSEFRVTRIPTKLQLTIMANPIVTRDNISNNFSLKQYATGELLKGNIKPGGGMW